MIRSAFPTVEANAWTGTGPVKNPGIDDSNDWGIRKRVYAPLATKLLLPGEPPDDRDWRHPKVGWGLVVPDRAGLSDADLAAGADLSAPLRKLMVLLDDWAGATCDPLAPLVWSVNHGGDDITTLMQAEIADTLWARLKGDADFGKAVRLKDRDATGAALSEALAARPGLVVTTSHGMTRTSGGAARLLEQLGVPVDDDYIPLPLVPPEAIPFGSIWYAHACCLSRLTRAEERDNVEHT